jgi:hypothetical protein
MPSARRRMLDVNRPSLAEDRTGPPAEITDDTIRDRAYELYEARGAKPGRDLDDWLQAEHELRPKRPV